MTIESNNRVAVTPLVTRFRPPTAAGPRTRSTVPKGYGIREQCLPFTAAAALGLSVPSPFSWGFCSRADVPKNGRAFRSPVAGGCVERCFYIVDDPAYDFEGNQFNVPPEIRKRIGPGPIPGLSFFERSDQQDKIKLHLPYIWRTSPGVNLLFAPPFNRARTDGLQLLTGLVECDWYCDAVNMVMVLPDMPMSIHVAAGDILAQAVPIGRLSRQPDFTVLQPHQRAARDMIDGLGDWRLQHCKDRAAYKRLVKSQSGVLTGITE